MLVRKLNFGESPPMELLLLADPSENLVKEYVALGACYVGEVQEQVMAVYVLLPIGNNSVEIMNIAISEDFQGRGLGKKLVMDAIQRARYAGYESIEIGTGNSSIHQLALYQKCGFRIIGIDHDFFLRNYDEEIVENGIPCVDMIRLSLGLNSN